MAKKKRKHSGATSPPASKDPGPFHAPFSGLKKALKKTAPPPPPPPPPRVEEEPAVDDLALFDKAMADIRRLDGPGRHWDGGDSPPPRLELPPDDDLEVMAHLADLVAGTAEFDLIYSEEYMEGALPGVGDELMERLKRGDFPLQDYLDLHGLSSEQALPALEEFLQKCAARGLRHVLVVHGRGMGSPGGVPVLKKLLPGWLGKKRLKRQVLAFCTALPGDGGTGAIYILLRRWSDSRSWV